MSANPIETERDKLFSDDVTYRATQHHRQAAIENLLILLESLGFTVNWIKAVCPNQSLTFLHLSEDRVSELLSLL